MPPVIQRGSANTIVVNTTQKSNPLLGHLHNVPLEFGDHPADYRVGMATGVLYITLRYHHLHPEYLERRINKMRNAFGRRIILVYCDVDNHQSAIKEICKYGVFYSFTVLVAWSLHEAARYIETLKAFEHKPPDLIKESVDKDYFSQLTNALTQIRPVNKTDVVSLACEFGSFRDLVLASSSDLQRVPGLGDIKLRRITDTFDAKFTG